MGYYINSTKKGTLLPARGKKAIMVNEGDAQDTERPARYMDIPAGKALIVVMDNGPFQAAGFCYNEAEFEEFTDREDRHGNRPRTYLLMDREDAEVLSNFKRKG